LNKQRKQRQKQNEGIEMPTTKIKSKQYALKSESGENSQIHKIHKFTKLINVNVFFSPLTFHKKTCNFAG
jgi:hypothetical protein